MATAKSSHEIPRLIGEPKNIRLMDVESATVIKAGAFVLSKDATTNRRYAIMPTSLADAGDAAANREAAADLFVGIALDGSPAGSTQPIRVATAPTQVYLRQKTDEAIEVGDLVEIYADADSCEDDTIVEGSTSQIARCIKSKSTGSVWVACELLPSKLDQADIQS